jgi:hypothetical protein
MKSTVICSMLLALCLRLQGDETTPAGAMRTWTEAATGRTVRGKIEGKREDGSEIRILLENHKAIWLPVNKLSEDDRKFVASWEVTNIRVEAKTVAMGTDRDRWAATWAASDRDTADILAVAGSQQVQGRTLGITIDNRGTSQEIIADVFWFGFPLKDKTERVVCGRATRIVRVPPEQRYDISCGMGYRYREDSLAYVHADFRAKEITGLFVDSWAGTTYAGWAVRISDRSGKILDESASQPAILGRLKDVPAPLPKKPKGGAKPTPTMPKDAQ